MNAVDILSSKKPTDPTVLLHTSKYINYIVYNGGFSPKIQYLNYKIIVSIGPYSSYFTWGDEFYAKDLATFITKINYAYNKCKTKYMANLIKPKIHTNSEEFIKDFPELA